MNEAAAFLWKLGAAFGPVHIIDVGANPIEGDAPYKSLLDAGYARLTGFEPQPEALASLNERKSDADTYFPNALGAGGPARLHFFRHSGFTSLFPIRRDVAELVGFARLTRPAGSAEISTERLDDLERVDPCDYLKIDVQGSELAIISNGRSKLAQAVLIQTEVRFLPLYEGEPSFGDLENELRAQGFFLHDFAVLKRLSLASTSASQLRRRTARQIIDGDAFFVRDLTRMGDWSNAQICRLALLAETVIASPSLAVFCLDALVARGGAPAQTTLEYIRRLPATTRRGD